MIDRSHSSSTVIMPEIHDHSEVARTWKTKFVADAICDEPEEDEEDDDYTQAMYECMCDIGNSLRLLAEVITRIEDKLK